MNRDITALEKHLLNMFRERNLSGMAIAIRGPEGIIFQKGFGFRNKERSLAPDENTVFGIASMSKSMTGLACCMLQTEGKLDLNDPIIKYFPSLHIPDIPDELVTIERIALHRAGIPPMEPLEWSIAMNSIERESDWYSYMCKTAPNKMDTIDQIAEYISEGKYPTLGMPGEYMSYSNEGYALLSYVVDQAAGITLEEYLQEKIFNPLQMTRTVLDSDCSEAQALAGGNITALFEEDENGDWFCDENWSVLPPFRGCACVKSTVSDMTKYYKMIADYGIWEGKQVIPKEAVDLFIGRKYPTREKPYYCMGLEKRLIGGKIVCQHSGGLHGISSYGGSMEGGYGITVLCNQGDVDVQPFQEACYNFILGQPLDYDNNWAIPCGKEFSAPELLCGDYVAHEGVPAHTIVKYQNEILGAVYGGTPVDLLYCGDNVFAAVSPEDHKKRISTFRFYFRNGKAWGVKCYTRIYQRVDEND